MDIVYHYPPDLLSLLIDTIPLLCRSKRDVLVFFTGAGVELAVFSDLKDRVDFDRENINKYEITRTILTRINDKGEASLRERREILKRITELEDFSMCWENDRLKAIGLVSQIRKIINVKDSFTRIKIEYESEKEKHRAEQRAKTEKLQKKQNELELIKRDLFSLFSIPPNQNQKRGKLLEGILNRLFKAYDILISEAFELVGSSSEGIIEQIDGVVEINNHLYLVEMKWWKEPIGVPDVSPHLVKTFSRDHAGGIFLSSSGFTAPAITTVKEALSKKVFILCELEEIVNLLDQNRDLLDFFHEKIQHALINKEPLYRPLG